MGRAPQQRPVRLQKKLRQVRLRLEFSQIQMYEALLKEGAKLHKGYVSLYETGERVPSLIVLLAYTRLSETAMEYFVDDKLDLP